MRRTIKIDRAMWEALRELRLQQAMRSPHRVPVRRYDTSFYEECMADGGVKDDGRYE